MFSTPSVFQVVPIASGPVTEHHWKEPGGVFFVLSLRYLDTLMRSIL